MPSGIDPSIPLSTVGGDPKALMSLLDLSMKLQANRQNVQAQNQLKQIFSDPSNLEDGLPTSGALSKIYAISPQYGMAIQKNMLALQNQKNMDAFRNSQTYGNFREDALSAAKEAVTYRDELMAKGIPQEQADQMAQENYTQSYDTLSKAGYSPYMKNVPTQFNYDRLRAFVDANKKETPAGKTVEEQVMDQYRKEHPQASAEELLGEQTKIKATGQETKGWELGTVTDKDGKSIPVRMNKNTGDIVPVDVPEGSTLGKLGAGQSAPASPELRKARGAMIATGMPIAQAVPGWGKQATDERSAAQEAAVKQIAAENNMSMEDAGKELANRQIDYVAGRRSVTQLNTMLGATRQAVGQLDYNIKQAKSEMKKLGSTDLSPLLNAIARGEEKWTGNPAYSSLFYFLHATAVESARMLSGGQASIAQLHQGAMEAAQEWVNINMTPASFDSVAQSMLGEGENRIQTYQQAIERQRIGGGTSPPAQATGPDAGTTRTYKGKTYKFTGGDPRDQKNWVAQ